MAAPRANSAGLPWTASLRSPACSAGGMWTTWGQAVNELGTVRGLLGDGVGLGMKDPRRPQAERNFRSTAEQRERPSVHIPTAPITVTRFSYSLSS